ncbi:4-hydroxyphenylacetate 3-hydroxylase N-terminal domain-containing protein [Lactococcus nasutitermitis]|uniref:4-hydroxyphenylacetate 3-hydroxylase N-terminal domain-containing protein n=1 Tax=Lactococcus nasutitermitis TaxID=1652957 RepID=A0ABV9JA17_9LACT|nr:4-hydroxyphenylacetate 3-hydroxylase N-terminal domain-containing protein [Lactococcus nasutitermitis]
MTTKKGNLNDGRSVYLHGKKVKDMAAEPVFSKTLSYIQKYYDLNASDTMFLPPKTHEDLVKKREIYEKVSRESYGFLGRTPDFINTGIAILDAYADVLGADERTNYAQNAKNWAKRVKSEDLFISHAIQNPQVDRSKGLTELLSDGQEFAAVWIKEKRPDGVIVRGAKQVNTLAPLADELLVFNLPGLAPADKDFALAFSLPLATAGVKVVCRKPTMKTDYSLKDYPLSGAFDEMDAFIILDDVFVPNESLFVCGSVEKSNAFFPGSGFFVHTAHQDEVRGFVKLEFVTALAVRLAEKLGLSQFLRVQEMLGSLTVNLEMIKSSIIASEVTAHMENGVLTPNMQVLLAVRASLTNYYDEALRAIAEFASGSIVGVPDFREFENEEIADILKASMTSPLINAEDRALLLNLAWDITGESFGQRQRTYEFLHGGNPMWIKNMHWQSEDLTSAYQMLDKVLENAKSEK